MRIERIAFGRTVNPAGSDLFKFMASKRKKKEPKPDPNPLFKQWVREWKEEAERKGWKTKYVYSKALKSLDQFPLVLKSGKEAMILESFGEKICQMLDEKLAAYRASGGVTVSSGPVLSVDSSDSDSDEILPSTCSSQRSPSSSPLKSSQGVSKRKATRTYIPAPRSGAYALLVTLYNAEEESQQSFLRKKDLLLMAQPLCEASFTMPNPGSHYTAWSTMSTLIRKQLVNKEGNPSKYSLTDTGRELATKLASVADNNLISSQDSRLASSQSSIQTTLSQFSQSSSLTEEEAVEKYVLEPGTFDIRLCVDNCETSGGGKAGASRKQVIIQELQKNGVDFEVRKLHVGDFLWIAKERVRPEPGQLRIREPRELVLDFVIERKRMDDLAQSIKDGRFHEQKFRLRNSGVRHPTYLVEDFGNESYQYGISRQALFQAINNTQVISGFTVKRTKDQKDSVAYLTLMTRALCRMYSCRKLESCSHSEIKNESCPSNAFLTFKEFNTSSMKNKVMTAKEMFIKQLLQISGLSVDKAVAITDLYDTPSKLIEAYGNCASLKEKEKLLAGLKYGPNRRNLGPAISKVLHTFYMTDFTSLL